jgi:hypothetical protein
MAWVGEGDRERERMVSEGRGDDDLRERIRK